MSVREYVGARYVPVFADPIEWDSANAYEPLTIVMYEGASYTSKTYVPVGVDIANVDYWALSGNYNAQVEAYREEVAEYREEATEYHEDTDEKINNLADRVTTNETNIETNTTLLTKYDSTANVMLYGGKENDNSIDWQTVVDTVAAQSDIIYFPAGTYNFTSGITIPDNVHTIIGDNSNINIYSNNGWVVDSDSTISGRFKQLSGFVFNGHNACSVILTVNCTQFNVYNCTFGEFTTGGIYASKLGLRVNNCIFNLSVATNGTYAVTCLTDSYMINNKIFGCANGFIVGNAAVITNNNFWPRNPTYQSCFAKSSSSAYSICCIITNNIIDGAQICFENMSGSINNNTILYNGSETNYTNEYYIFLHSNTPVYCDIIFNSNNFNLFNSVPFTIHTHGFSSDEYLNKSALTIRMASENNVIAGATSGFFYIGFGCQKITDTDAGNVIVFLIGNYGYTPASFGGEFLEQGSEHRRNLKILSIQNDKFTIYQTNAIDGNTPTTTPSLYTVSKYGTTLHGVSRCGGSFITKALNTFGNGIFELYPTSECTKITSSDTFQLLTQY